MSDCGCGLPEDAVILNQLRIVEGIDADGELFKTDLSSGPDGEELSTDAMFALFGWGLMINMLPNLAYMVREFDEDDDEEETAEV